MKELYIEKFLCNDGFVPAALRNLSPDSDIRSRRRRWIALPLAFFVAASATAYLGLVSLALFQSPWDKTVHFLVYGAIAFTLPPWLPARLASLAVWLPLVLAGADEWSQSLSSRRTSDVWDFAADAAGIALAYAIHRAASARRPTTIVG